MVKKIAFFSFVSIVGIVVLILAILISVLNWPSLIINERSLNYAKDYAGKIGIELKWEEVKVSTESRGFINENINISFKNIYLSHKPSLEKFSADEFSLGVGYAFAIFTPYITQVGPVIVRNGELAVILEESKEAGDPIEIPEVPNLVIPWWLKSALIKPLYVELANIGIRQSDGSTIGGKVLLNSDDPDSGNITLLKLVSNISGIASVQSLNAELQVDSSSGFKKNDWELDANSKLSLSSGEQIDLKAKVSPISKGVDYAIDLLLTKDKMRSDVSLAGKLMKSVLKATLKTDIRNPAPFIDNIAIKKCNVELKHGGVLKKRAGITLNCPVQLDLKPVSLPKEVKNIYEYKDITNGARTRSNAVVMELEMENGSKLKLTPDHLVLTKNRGYVEAGELIMSDDIVTM